KAAQAKAKAAAAAKEKEEKAAAVAAEKAAAAEKKALTDKIKAAREDFGTVKMGPDKKAIAPAATTTTKGVPRPVKDPQEVALEEIRAQRSALKQESDAKKKQLAQDAKDRLAADKRAKQEVHTHLVVNRFVLLLLKKKPELRAKDRVRSSQKKPLLQQARDAKVKALEKARKERADAAKRAEQEAKQKQLAEKRALQEAERERVAATKKAELEARQRAKGL
ncbi:unnamed protein product, partial [Ectocarpus fasciculatus]